MPVVSIFLSLFFTVAPASSDSPCPTKFEHIGNSLVSAGRTLGKEVLATAARSAVVPINPVDLFQVFYWPVIPVKIVAQTIRKLSQQQSKNHGLNPKDYFLVPLKMVYGNKHLLFGGYLVQQIASQRDIPVSDFLLETSDFESEYGEKPYIFVNAINEDRKISPWAESRAQGLKGTYEKFGVINFTDSENLVDSIIEFSKSLNEPVHGIEIMAHGRPGGMDAISWSKFEEFAEKKDLKKYISEDFKIRFISCALGCGKKGDTFLKQALENFTYPENKGTAYAAQVEISTPGVPFLSRAAERMVELFPGGIFMMRLKDQRAREAYRSYIGDTESPITVPSQVKIIEKEPKPPSK